MTTPAKLYGKDLSEYDEVDVDELLAQLSSEEIKILAKEVDPDVSLFITRVVSLDFFFVFLHEPTVHIYLENRVCRSLKFHWISKECRH